MTCRTDSFPNPWPEIDARSKRMAKVRASARYDYAYQTPADRREALLTALERNTRATEALIERLERSKPPPSPALKKQVARPAPRPAPSKESLPPASLTDTFTSDTEWN